VLLALLAGLLVAVAMVGSRKARFGALVAAVVGVVFVAHAVAHPPTNGALIFDPSLNVPNYFPDSPGAGPGETVALAGLGVAIAGLGISFTAD
jgi:hypothetical protein